MIQKLKYILFIHYLFYLKAQDLGVTILVKFTTPSFECLLQADSHKLSEVIRNLISNALKFCQKPGMIKVEVDTIPVSSYHDDQVVDSNNISTMSKLKRWLQGASNRTSNRPTSSSAPIGTTTNNANDTAPEYYLRLSVIDDGVGISQVHYNKHSLPLFSCYPIKNIITD